MQGTDRRRAEDRRRPQCRTVRRQPHTTRARGNSGRTGGGACSCPMVNDGRWIVVNHERATKNQEQPPSTIHHPPTTNYHPPTTIQPHSPPSPTDAPTRMVAGREGKPYVAA